MNAAINMLLGLSLTVLSRKKRLIITLCLIQAIFSAAILWGVPLVAGTGTGSVQYLTGAWHLCIIAVGLAVAPQIMAEWKIDGYFDGLKQLPFPRFLLVFVEVTSWIVATIPGVLFTPLLAFISQGVKVEHFARCVILLLAAAVIYISIGLTCVLSLKLEVVQVVSQVLMLIGLLFSPILYAADQLPAWALEIHRFLPFVPMSSALLQTASGGTVENSTWCTLVLWIILSFGMATAVMTHRRRAVLWIEEKAGAEKSPA